MVEYREEPCRTALNRVKGMPFAWSLNPYTGCAHRCTFCYVRGSSSAPTGPPTTATGARSASRSNVAEVLRRELARRSWAREEVTIGAATDPYQPAEGRYRLTRACIVELSRARRPSRSSPVGRWSGATSTCSRRRRVRAEVSVNVSVPTLDDRVWRTTEPGTAPPRRRLEIVRRLVDAGIRTNVAIAPILPGLSDRPELLAEAVAAAREAGAHHLWANVLNLRPGRASTSSRAWRATGRRSAPATSSSTATGATSRASEIATVTRSRRRARARACGDRPAAASAAAGPTQLTLV